MTSSVKKGMAACYEDGPDGGTAKESVCSSLDAGQSLKEQEVGYTQDAKLSDSALEMSMYYCQCF